MAFQYEEEALTKGADIERPVGVRQAILTHVIDVGFVDDKFNPGKKKHQGIMVFQLDAVYEKEGKTYPVQQSQYFTSSLNEKSTLRKLVEGILGTNLETVAAKYKAEGKKFILNLDKLIGRQCMLTIKKKAADSEYTTIESAAPKMKNLPDLVWDKTLPAPQWVLDVANDAKDGPGQADAASNVNLKDVMGDM